MKYHTLLLYSLCLMGLTACGSEDELTAIPDTMTDCFAPDPNATDAESVLRREFYQTEKCYLLFNDTLRHEKHGTDFNGDDYYFTETLDMGYILGSSTTVTNTYTYEYLQTLEEKKAVAAFLKEYVLPHLPNFLRPFSWFAVYSIMNNTEYTYPETLYGQRSVAIAVGYSFEYLTTEEKQALATSILTTTLGGSLQAQETTLTPFYNICNGLYDGDFMIDDPEDHELNMKALNEAGFLVEGLFWGVIPTTQLYPSKAQDLVSFTELVMNHPPQEVEELYAEYPIVIEKAELLRTLIEELGYIY